MQNKFMSLHNSLSLRVGALMGDMSCPEDRSRRRFEGRVRVTSTIVTGLELIGKQDNQRYRQHSSCVVHGAQLSILFPSVAVFVETVLVQDDSVAAQPSEL